MVLIARSCLSSGMETWSEARNSTIQSVHSLSVPVQPAGVKFTIFIPTKIIITQ